MFPSLAKEEAPINQTSPAMSAERFRRQTTDGPRFRANQTGPMSFVLEEPIVPTQPMVPSGPRRYQSSYSLHNPQKLLYNSHNAFISETDKMVLIISKSFKTEFRQLELACEI